KGTTTEVRMKKAILALAACSVANGCSSDSLDAAVGSELIGQTQQALDVNEAKSLTRKQDLALQNTPDDAQRVANTNAYYASVQVDNGPQFNSITSELNTLQKFIDRYGFDANRSPRQPARADFTPPRVPEQVAFYYNRGDLGIGR